jgi:hypothetical protein
VAPRLTGGAVSARLDLSDVDKGMESLRSVRLRPVFNALRKPLRDDQKDHAADQAGPDGQWAPRAASTMARLSRRRRGRTASGRRRRPRRPGRLLGRIPRIFDVRASEGGLVAENRAKYSLVHQEGGTVGRGARIPARPFLWFSGGFLTAAEEALGKALEIEWGR